MSTESRLVKVDRLKVQINQGLYRVDAIAVAKAILAHERRNTCPASPTAYTPVQLRPVGEQCVAHCRQVPSYRQPSVSSPSRGRKLNLRRRRNQGITVLGS